MLHGAISNSSAFFSPKAKGLGPFLASKGCNVFIADNRGRGFSKPSLKEVVKTKPIQHGQFETIRYDIPTISTAVKKISGQTKQHWIAHSWGGILMSSTMAYKGEKFTSHILSMICLGMCYHVALLCCYMLYVCAAFCFTSFCSSYLILTSHTHSLTLTYTHLHSLTYTHLHSLTLTYTHLHFQELKRILHKGIQWNISITSQLVGILYVKF
jgi:hypothetical protein